MKQVNILLKSNGEINCPCNSFFYCSKKRAKSDKKTVAIKKGR